MNAKLTLRLDDAIISQAKNYARSEGMSLSEVVSDYLRAIGVRKPSPKRRVLGPRTSKLRGSLKGMRVSERDYKSHLEKKYL